ncbi:MarR family winged helix-turn-helix transcriptional regulator [Acuticoccus kandeliae]|uniref:MarR family winged helix-turn-helix transcriptional regulator n=1 Tax=Acuticoccus kandeliae TaxID=2073160 RepID=UPI002481C3E4|nr:MarR family transcriptional regulator [Acuticoccus kandeliae]
MAKVNADEGEPAAIDGPCLDALNLPEGNQRYEFAEQAGHLLRKAYQRHTAIFQKLAPDPQITSVQLCVLCALAEQGPASLTTLGRATAIDPATMRGVVERLRERGFVALSPDQADRRKVLVSLTEEGAGCVSRSVSNAGEITRLTLQGLSVAEQVALTYLLKKISADN